jgi:deoxycytidine triphosphate deaminase
MSVLSDRTLKSQISHFLNNGSATQAVHCAYEFTAEKIFKGGRAAEPVVGATEFVEPTELVWVRSKENIIVPPDHVGIWVQTQSLSRVGLLLLNNCSLIEPGYSGPLTAVFVNFGQQKVMIKPGTKIAKVIFLKLDSEADTLVPPVNDVAKYDAGVLSLVANSPDSFMQVRAMAPSLRDRAEKIFAEQAEQHRNAFSEEVAKQRESLRGDIQKQRESLREDIQKQAFRWVGGSVVGFIVGAGLFWFTAAEYLPRITEGYVAIDKVARETVQAHISLLDRASQDVRNSQTDLRELREKVETLEKKRAAPSKPPGKTQK